MDDKEIESIVEKYVETSARVLERKDQERQLGSMLMAPPPPRVSWYMLVEHYAHHYILFWFQLLTWPTLALILWRLW